MIETIRTKFMERVAIAGPEDCWPWRLSTGSHGYGQWIPSVGHPVFGKNWLTHRLSWFLSRGPIPPGWTIDHECRNRRCCNPAHLRLRTNLDNARDNGMASRTHCPRGHAYEGHNLMIDGRGHRRCRTCSRERQVRA